jgi:biotin transport system substrate-specific component
MPSKTRALALVPSLLGDRARTVTWELATVGAGVTLLALLAQVAIPLPWTPVPITGQTFGVTLIALTFGQRAIPVVLAYLAAGAVGLPVFAAAKSGLMWGPTVGYLAGMVISASIIGTLADRGWTKSFWRTLAAGFAGSAAVFTCGLAVLSQFVPMSALLTAGLWPFMPGDVIKTTLAAAIVTGIQARRRAAR